VVFRVKKNEKLENSFFSFIIRSSALEDQASFHVKYDFSGSQYQKYHNLYKLHTEKFSLPKTWSVEPGTTDIGHDHCRGEWICHG
jgi:hypothetical protein